MHTDSERSAIANARDAKNEYDAYAAGVKERIAIRRNYAFAPGTGAAETNAFFASLGTQAGVIWDNNGKPIMYAMTVVGIPYEEIAKPTLICFKAANNEMRASSVAFPLGFPLSVWAIPAADLAAADAMIAAENTTPGTILAALIDAQPAAL